MLRETPWKIICYSCIVCFIAAHQDIQAPGRSPRLHRAKIVSKPSLNSKMIIDSCTERRYDAGMKKGIDYIGVGAGAIIFNKEGALFLAKRGKEARNEKYKWEFPGGSVEFGETLEGALVREVREEFGFEIEVIQLLDVVNHILPIEKQHWISPTYLCRYRNGKPRILEPHKCEKIGWFSIDTIPLDNLTDASRQSFESLKKYLSYK